MIQGKLFLITVCFLSLASLASAAAAPTPAPSGIPQPYEIQIPSSIKALMTDCNERLFTAEQNTNQTRDLCQQATDRTNRLADGYKFYVSAAFLAGVCVTALLNYIILTRAKRNG